MMVKRTLLSFLLLILCGCMGKPAPIATNPAGRTIALAELPEPGAEDIVRSSRLAFVGPFTELRVEVYGVPEMQRDILTDGEGNFSFPLIGTIAAAGKTPAAIEAEVTQKLGTQYVRNPHVTVNFKSPNNNSLALQSLSVTVDGQVTKPGSYPVVGRVTLMRAVALAGGVTEFAKLNDVIVFRKVGVQQYAGLYNLEAIRRGNYPDPEIFANDLVVVGDSPQRRLFKDILQSAPLLTTPLIVLTQNNR